MQEILDIYKEIKNAGHGWMKAEAFRARAVEILSDVEEILESPEFYGYLLPEDPDMLAPISGVNMQINLAKAYLELYKSYKRA